MKKCVHLHIQGLVQGVGFRYFVNKSARQHYLGGWVKNLLDGRVEVMAEGEELELQEFVSAMRKGSRFSTVQNVEVEWLPATNKFNHFQIID